MERRTRAYVDRLLPRTASKMLPFLKRMDEFSRASLDFDYDILDARWSNYGVVARCREELREAGRPATEIWSAEMYSPLPLLDAIAGKRGQVSGFWFCHHRFGRGRERRQIKNPET